MPVINDKGIAHDRWLVLGDEEPLPTGRPVIVTTSRLNEIAGHAGEAGLAIGPDQDITGLLRWFDRLALIEIGFRSFANGRGFSLAARLRKAGFEGILRASGHLIADQYTFLRSCGFDEIVQSEAQLERQPLNSWLADRQAITGSYQEKLKSRFAQLAARRAA